MTVLVGHTHSAQRIKIENAHKACLLQTPGSAAKNRPIQAPPGNLHITEAHVRRIFGRLDLIHRLHKAFLSNLQSVVGNWDGIQGAIASIGSLFCDLAPRLSLYMEYIDNHAHAMTVLEDLQSGSVELTVIVIVCMRPFQKVLLVCVRVRVCLRVHVRICVLCMRVHSYACVRMMVSVHCFLCSMATRSSDDPHIVVDSFLMRSFPSGIFTWILIVT